MGPPEFAVGTLKRLVESGYNVVAVVTQPDKPVGRHQDNLQPSAVKRYALEHDIPVLQPIKMKDPDFAEQLASYKADLQVVVAFRMLPEIIWSMPRMGTFNVHAALLPQYRGAAPINWAIILQKRFPIPEDANAEYVYDGLMKLGADIAVETIDLVLKGNGTVKATEQDEWIGGKQPETLHTAPKIFKETCQISWARQAQSVHNFVRGLSPYPGAWTTLHTSNDGKTEGAVLKIFKTQKTHEPTNGETAGTIRAEKSHLYIATADNWIEITELQLAGKKRMTARDFLNGNKNMPSCHVE